MTNASFLSLLLEVAYRVFDYCDTQTILLSVRNVCKQWYDFTKAYDRFKIQFDVHSQFELKTISRFIRPESIISLTISCKAADLKIIHDCFSMFKINKMTQLRSITFCYNYEAELHTLLSYIPKDASYSLSIKSDTEHYQITCNLVSALLTKYKCEKLYLHNKIKYDYKRREEKLWSSQCNLKSLLIDECTFDDYYTILQNLSYLKTLTVSNMSKPFSIEHFQSRTILNSTLSSLTFDKCQLSLAHIALLLSLTPELTYLKLICAGENVGTLFDGHYWEEFIQTKLCQLKQFQFFFNNRFSRTDNWAYLDDLITPFRTPFWLKEKHWFGKCNFVLNKSMLWLYTTPVCVSDLENSIRCELSVVDNICRLTKEPIYPKTNLTSKQVYLISFRLNLKSTALCFS